MGNLYGDPAGWGEREYSAVMGVFDAAMAWNAAFNGCDKYDFDAAVNRLRDACRKAEEVERETSS